MARVSLAGQQEGERTNALKVRDEHLGDALPCGESLDEQVARAEVGHGRVLLDLEGGQGERKVRTSAMDSWIESLPPPPLPKPSSSIDKDSEALFLLLRLHQARWTRKGRMLREMGGRQGSLG